MRISRAGIADVAVLARLLWQLADDDERAHGSIDEFTSHLARWWAAHLESHIAFIARLDDAEPVGMAWVALLPRVPRPGSLERMSVDIQSVFVMPQHRGRGIGSALIDAAYEYATHHGSTRATVHSTGRSVPLYERAGFRSSRQLLQRPPD